MKNEMSSDNPGDELKIAQYLARIETKIDDMKDNVTKIIYALLAIVCATVGVEFLASSPIDLPAAYSMPAVTCPGSAGQRWPSSP